MSECTMKETCKGVTLIELLVVVLIISVIAAVAQPQLTQVIVKARGADLISEMRAIRLAVYTYQTERNDWPTNGIKGTVPPGLGGYLPQNFNFDNEDYTLKYENWGGSPYTIGVSFITSDTTLGVTVLDMMSSPKWNSGDKYTWVFE